MNASRDIYVSYDERLADTWVVVFLIQFYRLSSSDYIHTLIVVAEIQFKFIIATNLYCTCCLVEDILTDGVGGGGINSARSIRISPALIESHV